MEGPTGRAALIQGAGTDHRPCRSVPRSYIELGVSDLRPFCPGSIRLSAKIGDGNIGRPIRADYVQRASHCCPLCPVPMRDINLPRSGGVSLRGEGAKILGPSGVRVSAIAGDRDGGCSGSGAGVVIQWSAADQRPAGSVPRLQIYKVALGIIAFVDFDEPLIRNTGDASQLRPALGIRRATANA